MQFFDRQDAGKKLGAKLLSFKGQDDTIVLGLARGGVVVANEVAKALDLPLEVATPRKLGAPDNPEFAIGAIDPTGEYILDERVIQILGIPSEYIDKIKSDELIIAKKRAKLFKANYKFKNKRVIIVDDGIATGATMKVTIMGAKKHGAKEIIVAVPVASSDSLQKISELADQTICYYIPNFFQAVGQFYKVFPQTTDEQVKALL